MVNEDDIVDAVLTVGDVDCPVTSATLKACETREVTIRLTEHGFREFITELRLQEYDADAADWLAERSTADLGPLEASDDGE